MNISAATWVPLVLVWLCCCPAQSRHLGAEEEDDGIERLLVRLRRFTSTPSFWTLPSAGSKPLVDKLTNFTLLFYTPIKDLYNIPVEYDMRIKLCQKDLFDEPSCVAGFACLSDLGRRLVNYRYYLRNLRNSGKGNKLSKPLLNSTVNALQDVYVNLQRECQSGVTSGALTSSDCTWPDPAVSCLPSGMGLAYDNNDVADETAVTLSRGLLEVTKRVQYL